MEKDPDLRFVCMLCDKKFPGGKSLGGHMRSHVVAAAKSAESVEKLEPLKKVSSLIGGSNLKRDAPPPAAAAELGVPSSGYGLRENPKKTWRAVDSSSTFFPPLSDERFCKQCGKGFQSMKALCGHMACHSEKERGVLKDDHSWTSDNPKLVMDSHSDTEAEDLKRQTRSKSKRYNNKIVVKSSHINNNNGSSCVSEIDELEQEEVAMCLMMMSRDSWNSGGVNSVGESSDNNSVVLETKSSSIDMKIGLRFGNDTMDIKKLGAGKLKLGPLDGESVQFENSYSGYPKNGMKKVESDISVDELIRNDEFKKKPKVRAGGRVEVADEELGKGCYRGKSYEIGLSKGLTREKRVGETETSSKSKRYRDGSVSPDFHKESIKKMVYHDSSDEELSKNARKRSKYEHLNCNKTFNSHQALGGHRPCHKKMNITFASRYESDENSLGNDNISPDSTPIVKLDERFSNKKPVEKRTRSKKSKGHECPICFRMFKSGQALGGHKRTHFTNGSDNFSYPSPVIKQESADNDFHDLIDLNLPAPEEDEVDENDQFIY